MNDIQFTYNAIDPFYTCEGPDGCGAAVKNTEKHRAFHDRLDQMWSVSAL